MNLEEHIGKIALIGGYLPRKCGIATFTNDMYKSISLAYPKTEVMVVPVNDIAEGYPYPPEVRFEFSEQDISSYERAADFLNFNNVDVVCLQHEFGIYGGNAGSHVLALLRDLKMPVITTLHTVLQEPDAHQKRVMKELITLSVRLVVMTERSKGILKDVYGVSPDKIDIIAHGIPDMPFSDPNFYKDQFGVEGKKVLLTFGLLSPSKGIEYVIQALPEVVKKYPELVYIVLGATHPNLVRNEGEAYRISLDRMVANLGVKKHVAFYNRFVEIDELKEFLGAADIYITPYLNPAQAVSGTLAYSFGCGKAVISTPYWHAEELLADGKGVLVPFADHENMAKAIIGLLEDDHKCNAMRKRAYLQGRESIWSQVAFQYGESFYKARLSMARGVSRRYALKTQETELVELPTLRLDHLCRITDSTGIFQHATYTLPNFHEGYCIDDNARALILAILLEETGDALGKISNFAHTYASFINYAYEPASGRFHNFMGFDRKWLDEYGSDDSLGRTLWALGTCVGRSQDKSLQAWAVQLFEKTVMKITEVSSPRAWAFALIGIHEYFRRLSGDRLVDQVRDILTDKLLRLYEDSHSEDWKWFEPVVSYDNGVLPHALILSGRWSDNHKALEVGLETARWLQTVQTCEEGHFRPVGSNGFYKKGDVRAKFDQQPVEAYSTVAMCLEAFQTTKDYFWLTEAQKALDWFLGKNDAGLFVYDANTGGCYDAIHVDRVNQNQGAESTLSFLLSLQEMRINEIILESYDRPITPNEA